MCDSIVHRGPDEEGLFVDRSVGLGMRRLSILDLSTGSQPIFNEDKSISLVFNGEIYNFQSLRDDLLKKGHQFRTQGDTEVIVHLYEQYGLDFAEHLNGMFAIAIWDSRRRRLILTRDRLGQKPLYYATDASGRLVFASEIKAILQSGLISATLDEAATYHYFNLGYIPHPRSIYKEISQLPPASQLVCENGQTRISRYWQLARKVEPPGSRAETAERIRELLDDAVRLRMISDVPLGAFLSGGLDSSLTVALMAARSDRPVKTFHVDFGESDVSEADFAREVARLYGCDHHEMRIGADSEEFFRLLTTHLDEPLADSSAVPTYFVSKLAREHVTVALAGDGGDESFGGYSRYRRALRRATRPAVRRAAMAVVGRTAGRFMPRFAPGRRYVHGLALSNDQAFAVGTAELETRALLTRDFLGHVNSESTFGVLSPAMLDADATDALAPLTHLDSVRYLPDDILTKVDRMSMANSLEVRSPFLDHRVFELAATLPHDWKIENGRTKAILRDAFAGDLPDSALNPQKRGFSMPVARWMRSDLRPALEEAINARDVIESGIFSARELRALNREQDSRRNRSRAIDSSCSDMLWRFLVFVQWWREHRPVVAG